MNVSMPEAVGGGWLCIRGPVYEQPFTFTNLIVEA